MTKTDLFVIDSKITDEFKRLSNSIYFLINSAAIPSFS